VNDTTWTAVLFLLFIVALALFNALAILLK